MYQGQSLSDVFVMYAELPARMVATLSEPDPYLAYSKDSRWQLYTLLGDVADQLYRQITFSFPLKEKQNESKSNVFLVCLVQPARSQYVFSTARTHVRGFPTDRCLGERLFSSSFNWGFSSVCASRGSQLLALSVGGQQTARDARNWVPQG